MTTEDRIEALIRATAKRLEAASTREAALCSDQFRDAGIVSGCHVGKGAEMKDCRLMRMEWFAGQLIDIVESKSWFAVNSWLNCVDKFCE